jgi:hypothetical protein
MPKAGSVPRATFGIGEGQEGFLKGWVLADQMFSFWSGTENAWTVIEKDGTYRKLCINRKEDPAKYQQRSWTRSRWCWAGRRRLTSKWPERTVRTGSWGGRCSCLRLVGQTRNVGGRAWCLLFT